MNIHIYKALIFVFCFSLIPVQAAENQNLFSIDFGENKNDISVYRIELQKDLISWLKSKGLPVSIYYKSSINYWKGRGSEVYGIAFSPVFIAHLIVNHEYQPYIEVGTGISLISAKKIENINMSSLYQFENRIGFGIKRKNMDIHLRYMHYSNAGIVKPNHGIDILLTGIAYNF